MNAEIAKKAADKEDAIMRLRWVLTDKAAALRTKERDLAVEASARLVLPGYKDRANIQGELRRDAPTGSRHAQHLLFTFAAAHPECMLAHGLLF